MPTKKKIAIQPESGPSPAWDSSTKLLIGLTLIALVAALIWYFSNLVTPLMMVFILVYLLHPIAVFISRTLHVSWSVAVAIIYLLMILIVLGLLTISGVGLVQQVQSLIASVQDIIANLPAYMDTLTSTVYRPFNLFTIDLTNLDFDTVGRELISYVQPVLGQTGTLVGTLAASAAESIGWTAFIFTVSFFVMLESSGMRRDIIKVDIPGYQEDVNRIMHELTRIWNAFLRGQLIIFFLALVMYSILLPILGVRYSLGIALMAALAKFLPYIGPAITWTVLGLVSFFQVQHAFGLQPLTYTLLVLGIILFIDQIIDSLIAPRIMADALKVHPAAVLVAIIMGASLFGLLGVVIAAPLLATFTLLVRYAMRKMLDLDPWEGQKVYPEP
ncbi:MAG: AI-2E family transporter, partial [Anaerolineales bacterium]|nr:AI-2E family transporter [Anaerolineales bacterium]